jgi:hypothetical protein
MDAGTPDDRLVTGKNDWSGEPDSTVFEDLRQSVDCLGLDCVVIVDEHADARGCRAPTEISCSRQIQAEPGVEDAQGEPRYRLGARRGFRIVVDDDDLVGDPGPLLQREQKALQPIGPPIGGDHDSNGHGL